MMIYISGWRWHRKSTRFNPELLTLNKDPLPSLMEKVCLVLATIVGLSLIFFGAWFSILKPKAQPG